MSRSYVVAIATVVLIVALGGWAVVQHIPASIAGHSYTWATGDASGYGTAADHASKADPMGRFNGTDTELPGPAADMDPATLRTASGPYTGGGADVPGPASAAPGADILAEVASFMPSGLLSIMGTVAAPKRSTTQQALYDYGNEVGGIIASYDAQYAQAQASIMTDYYADRTNTDKANAVARLGHALAQVGTDIDGLSDQAPASMSLLNTRIARGYETIGTKLAAIPAAKGDAALLQAINDYDASVDDFTRDYISMASTFSLAGVVFAAGDPGSVFTFQQSAGL